MLGEWSSGSRSGGVRARYDTLEVRFEPVGTDPALKI